jgi:predicted kinase
MPPAQRTQRPQQVTLICGPPGSGKSSLALREHKPGDLVLDYDYLMAALSGGVLYEHHERVHWYVMAAWNAVVTKLRREPDGIRAVWIVASLPEEKRRLDLAAALHAEVKVLEVSAATCKQRIMADPNRSPEAKSRCRRGGGC